jgi:hypothetical protein
VHHLLTNIPQHLLLRSFCFFNIHQHLLLNPCTTFFLTHPSNMFFLKKSDWICFQYTNNFLLTSYIHQHYRLTIFTCTNFFHSPRLFLNMFLHSRTFINKNTKIVYRKCWDSSFGRHGSRLPEDRKSAHPHPSLARAEAENRAHQTRRLSSGPKQSDPEVLFSGVKCTLITCDMEFFGC